MLPINKTIIISLGGSLIVPNQVDTNYLKQFLQVIHNYTKKNYRFVIFTGGGAVARNYQLAGNAVQKSLSKDAQDWIGIKASWLNAELVKQLFGKLANDVVITDPRVKLRWSKTKPVFIGAGWKPGRSTDYDAVRLALENNIHSVINLSNIDYVYTKDPNKYPDATKIEQITWADFRKMIGNTWDPGAHVPFDPIAAKLAQQHDVKVTIMNGAKLEQVKKAIEGMECEGTVVE